MEKEFLSAFADIIREQVVQKNEVQISDLGVFKREHVSQFQEQFADGRVVMMPPKDEIRFIPE